jgi:hypothetical protein
LIQAGDEFGLDRHRFVVDHAVAIEAAVARAAAEGVTHHRIANVCARELLGERLGRKPRKPA